MKTTASVVASLTACLLASSCGSSTPSPSAPSASPPPSPSSSPAPPGPTFLYTLQHQGARHVALLGYRVEPQSGRLTPLGSLEVRGAEHLAGARRGATLHVDWCLEYKRCEVASLRLDAAGLPALASTAGAPSANIMSLLASDEYVFARWDDSSTAYSAGLVAYRVEPGTGQLGPPVIFAHRGGRYSTAQRLYSFGLGHDGSRVYTAESGGRLASYPVDEAGPGEKIAESGGHPDRAPRVVAHPRGGFVYVLSQTSDTGDAAYVTTYALDAEGTPAFRASVPVGPQPHSMAVEPDGRWLWVSGRAGIEAFGIDPQSGVPELVRANRVGPARGFMAAEPQGRFLYLLSEDGSGLTAFSIDRQTGALAEIGPQGPGDTNLVVLERPLSQ